MKIADVINEVENYEDAISTMMGEMEKYTTLDDEAHFTSPAPRGMIDFAESPYPNTIEIASVAAIDPKGGQNIMRITCTVADQLGLGLSVHASPIHTEWRSAGDLDALVQFYEQFGFRADRKRNEPWDWKGEHLIRRAKRRPVKTPKIPPQTPPQAPPASSQQTDI